ncbi:hypothetical protein NPIL_607331 [Nephila pilipes]|uniref:Uncharacterized protein n=1 Tax=Nephila pilipes TaxID=299642 RepID=A0A8X6QI46_NEPPI|nr:hypothetical protein NPIL_607331 [Nephila pilipes]
MYSSLLLDETRARSVDTFTSARRDNHPGIRQTIWQYPPVRPFLSGVANNTKHLCSGVTHSIEGYHPISFSVPGVEEVPSRREQTKRILRSRRYDPQIAISDFTDMLLVGDLFGFITRVNSFSILSRCLDSKTPRQNFEEKLPES